MKYRSLVIMALLATCEAVDIRDPKETAASTKDDKPTEKPNFDHMTHDGQVAMPKYEHFKVPPVFVPPKNNEAEPALSTNAADPHDYESGSGKTYHVKKNKEEEKEEGGDKKKDGDEKKKDGDEKKKDGDEKKNDGEEKKKKKEDGDEKKKDGDEKEEKKDGEEESGDKKKKKKPESDAEKAEKADAEKVKAKKEEKKEEGGDKAEKKEEKKEEAPAEKKADKKEEAAEDKKGPKKDDDEGAAKDPAKTAEDPGAAESLAQKKKVPISNSFVQTDTDMDMEAGCEPAIDVSQKQLDIELDYFSRNFDRKHYKKALQVYGELKKQGKDPKVSIHTWELYDKSFSFPRVRRYDLVQKHMDLIQHFQDNLNENFTNKLHFENFLKVANDAREALNEKYHDGEFSDPANFDPEAAHPVTWATANLV